MAATSGYLSLECTRPNELSEGCLGAVIYKPNMLGMRGPRKLRVLVPNPTIGYRRRKCLLEKYKERDWTDLITLLSKDAEWDKDMKSYVLNYHGRASQVSTVFSFHYKFILRESYVLNSGINKLNMDSRRILERTLIKDSISWDF